MAQCCIAVDREKLWESSRRALEALPPHHLLRPLRVTFVGEDGADYGGLRREWFHLVTLEMVLSLLALLLALLSQFTCFTVACVGRGARRCSVYVLLLVQKKGKC